MISATVKFVIVNRSMVISVMFKLYAGSGIYAEYKMYAGSDFYAGCKIVAGRELCAGSIQFSNSTSCAGCGHSAYTQARHCNMPVERFWQGPNSYSSLPSIHIHFQASQQHLQAT